MKESVTEKIRQFDLEDRINLIQQQDLEKLMRLFQQSVDVHLSENPSISLSDLEERLFPAQKDIRKIEIPKPKIILPKVSNIITISNAQTNLLLNNKTKKEIDFLINSLFPDPVMRAEFIDKIFYENRFLYHTMRDIGDLLKYAEDSFQKRNKSSKKKPQLSLVQSKKTKRNIRAILTKKDSTSAQKNTQTIAQNDEYYGMDGEWYDYVHDVFGARYEYAKGLYCQIITEAIQNTDVRVWSTDPWNTPAPIGEKQEERKRLLAAITEYHKSLDGDVILFAEYIDQWILALLALLTGLPFNSEKARKTFKNAL